MWIYLKTVYNSLSLSLLLENNVSQEFSWLIPFFAGTLQASGHLHYSTLRNSYLYFLNYLFYIQFTFLFFRDTRDSYIHPLVCFSFLSAFFFIFCFFLELFSFSPGAPWSFSWCYSAAQTFYWVFYIIILSISDCRVFISAIKLFCALLVTCASVSLKLLNILNVMSLKSFSRDFTNLVLFVTSMSLFPFLKLTGCPCILPFFGFVMLLLCWSWNLCNFPYWTSLREY